VSDGDRLVRITLVGTAVFVVSASLGAAFPDALGIPSAAVAGVLFVGGCVAFLWAYAIAVSRSREELVTVPGVFFLSGSAPKDVRWRLHGATLVQVVVALTTAGIRPFSPLAFGVLAPMFGIGMTGLWGARCGQYPPRPADQ
jgi:hypothetical protein